MAIVRFDPRRSMMRLPDFWDEWDTISEGTLAVDVYETDADVVIKMPMAGVNPENIDVTITGDTVTVRGTVDQETEDSKRNYYLKEVRHGAYARSVTLPAPVQADKAQATSEHGILTLTLPKAEEAKPKSIKVTTTEK